MCTKDRYIKAESAESKNRLALELFAVWKKAPVGSDVFVLMAEHAIKVLDKLR